MTQVKILLFIAVFFLLSGEAMASNKPWEDWPDTDIEAGWYVKNEGIFQGHVDGLFHPHNPITSFQFCNVLEKIGIPIDRGYFQTTEVYMKDTQKFLPGTMFTANPESLATRYRTAVMIYRYKTGITDIDERIEALLKEKPVTWNGVTRNSRLIGYGKAIVDYSRTFNIPIWLALGQCWRESQWFTTGLSIEYNCGWGMKDREIKPGWAMWGPVGNPASVKGFTNYMNLDDAIHAYFKLMSSPDRPYRALIDKYLAEPDQWKAWGYITQALDIYAPGYENDTIEHHKIVRQVKTWCDERGIK